MIKVKTKIPSGSLTLLTKPNAAGECAVYLRYYLGSYIKKSTDDIKAEIDKALLEYDGQITADVIRSIMTGDDKGEVPLQRGSLHWYYIQHRIDITHLKMKVFRN